MRLPVELKVVHLLQAGGKGGGGEAQVAVAEEEAAVAEEGAAGGGGGVARPALRALERLERRDVVHHDRRLCPPVVHRRERLVPL